MELFRQASCAQDVLDGNLRTARQETWADQWQAQILAGILVKHRVILVSDCARELVEEMRLRYAGSMEEALRMAEEMVGRKAKITFLPEGMSMITSPI